MRNRKIRKLIRELDLPDGTTVTLARGHIRICQPGCRPVFTGGTPSDRRTRKNLEADLRRVRENREAA